MTLQVKALSKAINHQQIIEDISFDWAPGEIIGLVGRNGVGKTTLFRTLTNQYVAEQGQVLIDGQSTTRHPLQQRQLFFLDG
ncbi:ATP-binding cassette domain-containing protein [Levilactobacillus brevis]|nr:ATP-binding cassette domain-containing protein [Levilactobacillus brevis]KIO94801.1 ABC transporter, ATP-binding protein [Levilactobacillus brevis]KIO97098.1 ABC transporter, ATP-binding protein [Levilactobacillus brevis]